MKIFENNWMKMMQMMVNRRQVPGRKQGSAVNDSLNDGLALSTVEQQDSQANNAHQQRPQYPVIFDDLPEPDCSSFPGSFLSDNIALAESDNGDREAGEPTQCEDNNQSHLEVSAEYDDGSLIVPSKRVHLGATKHYPPHPKIADGAREARLDRLASFDHRGSEGNQLEDIRVGPTLLSSLSFREMLVPTEGSELIADDSTGRFAYISLDGRLINAELATSAMSIGGGLGDKEAQVWEDFAPMQRVLIVAVSAAAAAAAKHKNSKEIDRLLKIVTDRENELALMRQQLHRHLELCKQPITDSQPDQLTSMSSKLDPTNTSDTAETHIIGSPKTPPSRECSTMRRIDLDNEDLKLKFQHTDRELLSAISRSSSLSRSRSDFEGDELAVDDCLGYSRDPPVNKDVVLVETPSRAEHSETYRAKEEAKWYVNPMTARNYHDMCITPERGGNPMISTCAPVVHGSLEWKAVSSSFSSRKRLLPYSVDTDDVQKALDDSRQLPASPRPRHEATDKLTRSRARCVAAVLVFMKQGLAVLEMEASKLVAALNSSVEEARTQAASMQLSLAGCLQAEALQALAAIGLSPFEFDSYMLKDSQTRSNNDMSEIDEGIQAWRQYLEGNRIGEKTPLRFNDSSVDTFYTFREIAASDCAARVEMTSMITPRDSVQGSRVTFSTESKLRRFGFPEDSSEFIVEELLGELDNAAAKVADMEQQIKRLEQTVVDSEAKRKHAESKLAGSIKRSLDKQMDKVGVGVVDLRRMIQSKEAEISELDYSRKQYVQTHKNKKKERKRDEETSILCSLSTPKGYGTIYWDRAAISGKLNLHSATGSLKSRKTFAMTKHEPKIMLLMQSEDIIEQKEEDCNRPDAEVLGITAAAPTINTASTDRIAILEDICKQKDTTIFDLKQEVLALETKLTGIKASQFPAMLRGQQTFTSTKEIGRATTDFLPEHPLKRNFTEDTPFAMPPTTNEQREQLQPSGIIRQNHFGEAFSTNTQLPVVEDGGNLKHGCEYQESSKDLSSPPGSTIGDDCSELEHSLQGLSVDEKSIFESDTCSFSEKSRSETPEDQLPGRHSEIGHKQEKEFDTPEDQFPVRHSELGHKHKTISPVARRLLTTTSIRGVRANLNFTFATRSKLTSGEKHSSKSGGSAVTGDKKVLRRDFKNLRTSLGSLKVLGSVAPNTTVSHRRASSLDLKGNYNLLLEAGGSMVSGFNENSAIKRRRWV